LEALIAHWERTLLQHVFLFFLCFRFLSFYPAHTDVDTSEPQFCLLLNRKDSLDLFFELKFDWKIEDNSGTNLGEDSFRCCVKAVKSKAMPGFLSREKFSEKFNEFKRTDLKITCEVQSLKGSFPSVSFFYSI
jgi:hypothetical protein